MLSFPDGETRIHLILGDPVAQTRAPAGLTAEFRRRGVNAICIPLHVAAVQFGDVMAAIGAARNVDGMVVTIPHKFAALRSCARASARARRLGAANVLRRTAGGAFEGDMTDGAGTVLAIARAGRSLEGSRALVVGAGGAGSAVALALLDGGVAALAIADVDAGRCAALLARLADPRAAVAAPDPRGCDVVVNATPSGMAGADPLPLEAARLEPSAVVVDLVPRPAMTRLLVAARERGCTVVTGVDMFAAGVGVMADFLLAGGGGGPPAAVANAAKSR